MKFLIFFTFCSLSFAEYAVKTHDDLLKFRSECVAELNVPAGHVEQFKQFKFPNDSVTQCYIKCIFGKFGLFDAENGFNVENVHKQLVGGSHADHSDDVHDKITACADKNEQGSNACEWAYRGATCIMKNNMKLVKSSVQPVEH